MGVQTFLLDRRMVTLLSGDVPEKIGTARSFWKVTELDKEREAEIDAVKASLRAKVAPVAVMIADVSKLSLASAPNQAVAAHVVLGWDEDRATVTDSNWDYLPLLGYAVKTKDSARFELHEERDGLLYPLTKNRAVELEILDTLGRLIRRGQPSIIECQAIKPFTPMYAEADCRLSDGRMVQILTSIRAGEMPPRAWYAGKRPTDATTYRA